MRSAETTLAVRDACRAWRDAGARGEGQHHTPPRACRRRTDPGGCQGTPVGCLGEKGLCARAPKPGGLAAPLPPRGARVRARSGPLPRSLALVGAGDLRPASGLAPCPREALARPARPPTTRAPTPRRHAKPTGPAPASPGRPQRRIGPAPLGQQAPRAAPRPQPRRPCPPVLGGLVAHRRAPGVAHLPPQGHGAASLAPRPPSLVTL